MKGNCTDDCEVARREGGNWAGSPAGPFGSGAAPARPVLTRCEAAVSLSGSVRKARLGGATVAITAAANNQVLAAQWGPQHPFPGSRGSDGDTRDCGRQAARMT